MAKKEFSNILKEYGYSDRQIELLWDSKPEGDIDEQRLRRTAKDMASMKNTCIQA